MAGLCSPLHRGFLHHPADAQPRWQGARSPGTQRPPRATFVWEPPGRWEQGPAGQCLCPDTDRIHGSSRTGAARGISPPPVRPTKRAFRAGSGRLPRADQGRPRGQQGMAFPRWAGCSQHGACCQQMHRTRCSHAAMLGCLSPSTRGVVGGTAWPRAPGRAQGGRSQAPCLSCPAPCVSHHVLLPAHPAACGNQGQPSVLVLRRAAKGPSQRREVTGAMPGALEELGFVSIAANTGQGR